MKKLFITLSTVLAINMATITPARASVGFVDASISSIHSIGTVTDDKVNVNALVKGVKSGSPYRLRMIPIQKQIIGQWLKAGAGAVLRRSPYWIAATAAMGLLVSDTGEIKIPSSDTDSSYIENKYYYIYNGGMHYGRTYSEACSRFVSVVYGSSASYSVSGSKCYVGGQFASDIYGPQNCPSNSSAFYCQPYIPPEPEFITLSDSDFIDSITQYIAANPSVDALTDPDNPTSWVHIEPQGLTYIPEADNGQDEAWIQSVLDGAAQSTDSTAPNYVPADQLDRIEALANQIAAGNTAEGVTDAANAAADAAVTQGTLADMLAAEKTAADAATDSATTEKDESMADINEKFDLQLENLEPPGLPSLFSLPRLDSTSCLSVDINWQGHSTQFPGQWCDKIEQGKSILGYVLFFLAMWNLALAVLREVN